MTNTVSLGRGGAKEEGESLWEEDYPLGEQSGYKGDTRAMPRLIILEPVTRLCRWFLLSND